MPGLVALARVAQLPTHSPGRELRIVDVDVILIREGDDRLDQIRIHILPATTRGPGCRRAQGHDYRAGNASGTYMNVSRGRWGDIRY